DGERVRHVASVVERDRHRHPARRTYERRLEVLIVELQRERRRIAEVCGSVIVDVPLERDGRSLVCRGRTVVVAVVTAAGQHQRRADETTARRTGPTLRAP